MDKKEVFIHVIQGNAGSVAINEIKRRLGEERGEEAISIIKELAAIDVRIRKHLDNMEIVPVEDIERNNELIMKLEEYEKESEKQNTEINIGNIKGLRRTLINCSDIEKSCDGCPLESKNTEGQNCLSELMKDAADAIGELINKIETDNEGES